MSTKKSTNLDQNLLLPLQRLGRDCDRDVCRPVGPLVELLSYNGSIPSRRQMDKEDRLCLGLRRDASAIVMSSSNMQLPPGATGNNEAPTNSQVPCYAVILWSPKILKELELHAEYQDMLFSTMGIGRMFSEVVINENAYMNWKEPFILLDVMYDEGYEVTGNLTDHSINIPVVEKRVADNRLAPISSRLWELTVSECCMGFGLEIIRQLPTTLMIWGARKVVYEDRDKSKFKGEILLDTYFGPVNVLIFHHEEMTLERIRDIQGNFSNSELSSFNNGFRRRIINNRCTNNFSVHLSKLALNSNPTLFTEQFESKVQNQNQTAQVQQMHAHVQNTIAEAESKPADEAVGEDMEVASEILYEISQTIPEGDNVLLEAFAQTLVQKLAEPDEDVEDQNPEVGVNVQDDKGKESVREEEGDEAKSNISDNDALVVDEEESVSKFAATQTLAVDTDDEDDDDKVNKSQGAEHVEVSNDVEVEGASQASDYRFTEFLDELAMTFK